MNTLWKVEAAVVGLLRSAAIMLTLISGACWVLWAFQVMDETMPVVRVTACAGGLWLLYGMFDVLRNDRLPVKELP